MIVRRSECLGLRELINSYKDNALLCIQIKFETFSSFARGIRTAQNQRSLNFVSRLVAHYFWKNNPDNEATQPCQKTIDHLFPPLSADNSKEMLRKVAIH
jgi:hypothetical protein